MSTKNIFPIKTSRLIIRPIEVTDAAAIYDFKKESWQDLLEWLIWVHPPSIKERTLEDEIEFCRSFCLRNTNGSDLICLAFDRQNNRLIGTGSLHGLEDNRLSPFLGFNVRSSETKKGYATEIAIAICHFAFVNFNSDEIRATHAQGNIGSEKVIRNTGFQKVKVLRNVHRLSDKMVDEHHYVLKKNSLVPF